MLTDQELGYSRSEMESAKEYWKNTAVVPMLVYQIGGHHLGRWPAWCDALAHAKAQGLSGEFGALETDGTLIEASRYFVEAER